MSGPANNPLTRFNIQAVFLACFLLLSAGCGREPSLARLSESSVVVAFGDSLTAGSGARESESYPSVLAKLMGCRVINAGVHGEVSSSGLERLPGVFKKTQPDLLILCHGGNDLLRKEDRGLTKANLNTMISMAKNTGSDVILLGVPKPGLRLRPPPFYKELAEQHNIPFDEKSISKILSTRSLRSGQVHPNAAGYRQLAERVASLIWRSEM